MKIALLFLVLLLPMHLLAADAPFYQWVDSAGVTHFTDNPDKIPAKFRKRAKKMRLPEQSSGAASATPQHAAPAAPAVSVPEPLSFDGQPEQWWRGRFAELRTQLKALQAGLTGKQTKLAELRRKRAIYTRAQDRVALNSMQAEISADEVQIAQLQKQIAELDLQASKAGVPAEWR
jgi:bacterioferritin (cytochrome b1)